MKIYTKTGDKGTTHLIGGKEVPKNHIRIEAYGTLDELIAHIGLLKDIADNPQQTGFLQDIQNKLMICASVLASDCENCEIKLPEISGSDIQKLESSIDQMETLLPVLKSFVLPGGHIVSSQCHIARTVCRRAERKIIQLSSKLFVPETVLQYINRLSDYLFVLSRKVLHDKGKKDTHWIQEL